jgi:TfoX/Sxy family transcriptional regulator of competence genes
MASSKEYIDFILEQLSELEDITYKAMMECTFPWCCGVVAD